MPLQCQYVQINNKEPLQLKSVNLVNTIFFSTQNGCHARKRTNSEAFWRKTLKKAMCTWLCKGIQWHTFEKEVYESVTTQLLYSYTLLISI